MENATLPRREHENEPIVNNFGGAGQPAARHIVIAHVTYVNWGVPRHLMGWTMSNDPTRDFEPAPAEAHPAGVRWDIEDSKRFALALGISPEQVAALFCDASAESPSEGSPRPSGASASPAPAGEPMSKYRVAFLVWWTTIVLFVASFIYVNWDLVSTETLFASLAAVTLAFGAWIPGAFLRLLRP